MECEEGLVWLLAGLALSSREDNLEGVGRREAHSRGENRGERQSVRSLILSQTNRRIHSITHFSLAPPPMPAPFS
jgi:hypothetical protein